MLVPSRSSTRYCWIATASLGCVLIPSATGAGPVGVGFRVGAPLRPVLEGSEPWYRPVRHPAAWGASLEIRFSDRWALEANALYRKLSYELLAEVVGAARPKVRTSRWEFPVLVKHRWGGFPLAPYLSAGLAWNRTRDPTVNAASLDSSQLPPLEFRHARAWGPAAAAGIELPLLVIRLGVEVRYTHWGERNFGTRGSPLRSTLDQLELLLGLTF